MLEWTRDQWEETKDNHKTAAFYLYTPLCGTCQVAGKMLDIVEELVNIPIGKGNLNYMEDVAIDYEVESVPCLLISRDGEIQDKIYAFQSVTNVYEKLKD